MLQHVRPDGGGVFHGAQVHHTMLQGIAQERSEEIGMFVVGQEEQQMGGELKGIGELMLQLQHAVEELEEDGWTFIGEMRVVHTVTTTILELISKRTPIFLDQNSQTFYGAVVRV